MKLSNLRTSKLPFHGTFLGSHELLISNTCSYHVRQTVHTGLSGCACTTAAAAAAACFMSATAIWRLTAEAETTAAF